MSLGLVFRRLLGLGGRSLEVDLASLWVMT